jgi:chromate reductase
MATVHQHEPPYRVGYFIGSLSKNSLNRRLANALLRIAPPEFEMFEIRIGDLPLYNYDFDNDPPPAVRELKESIAQADAVMFITPEYNRSIPGPLKNAIDWASRPYGHNSFAEKASVVIGASPGKIGTAVAQQTMLSLLSYCNSPQMNSPEAYIQVTPGLITDDGEITDSSTKEFLEGWLAAYSIYIQRVLTVIPKPN